MVFNIRPYNHANPGFLVGIENELYFIERDDCISNEVYEGYLFDKRAFATFRNIKKTFELKIEVNEITD